MARNWDMAAGTGLGHIVDAYQKGQEYKLARETQKLKNTLAINADREGNAKFGAENGADPIYDEKDPNSFKGYGLPKNAADVMLAHRQMKQNLGEDPSTAPSWDSSQPPPAPQLPFKQASPNATTSSGRPLAGPGLPSWSADEENPVVKSLQPTQAPGDPRPILVDHKAKADLIKHTNPVERPGELVADQEANQGKGNVIATNPDGSAVRVVDGAPVSGSGMDVAGRPERKIPDDMSLFLRHRLIEQGTAVPRLKLDENVNVDTLSPEMRKRYGIDSEQHGNVPLSLLQGGQKGTYGNTQATIKAMAAGVDPENADLLSAAEMGSGVGQVAREWSARNPGKIMPPGLLRAFRESAQRFNQGRNYNLRADIANENQAGKGAAAVDANPVMRTYQQRSDGADRAAHLIAGMRQRPGSPGYVIPTAENLHNLGNEIGRLETGANAVAESNLSAGEIRNRQAELQRLFNQISGDVQPAQIEPQLHAAELLIRNLKDSYSKVMRKELHRLRAGRGAKQGAAIDSKIKQFEDEEQQAQNEPYQKELADAQGRLKGLSGPDLRIRQQKYDEYLKGKYGKGLNGK